MGQTLTLVVQVLDEDDIGVLASTGLELPDIPEGCALVRTTVSRTGSAEPYGSLTPVSKRFLDEEPTALNIVARHTLNRLP